MTRLRGGAALLASALMAACGSRGPAPDHPAQGLAAAAAVSPAGWRLTSMDDRPPHFGSRITLEVGEREEGTRTVGGFSGCNAYGGTVSEEPAGRLTIGEISSTAAACSAPEGVMDQESTYLRRLGSVTAARLESGRLVLELDRGVGLPDGGEERAPLVFEPLAPSDGDPTDLIGTAWRLDSLNGRPTDGTYTMLFPAPALSVGRAGCRTYVSRWVGGPGRISFQSTAMAGEPCDERAGEEGTFTDALTWARSLDVEGDRWELRSGRGETLVFVPLAPGDARSAEGTWALRAILAGPDAPLEPVPADAGSTLRLDGGTLEGNAGCNGYGGTYRLDGRHFTAGDLVRTKMYCTSEGVMEREERVLELLGSATGLMVAGDLLWLSTPDGGGLLLERT